MRQLPGRCYSHSSPLMFSQTTRRRQSEAKIADYRFVASSQGSGLAYKSSMVELRHLEASTGTSRHKQHSEAPFPQSHLPGQPDVTLPNAFMSPSAVNEEDVQFLHMQLDATSGVLLGHSGLPGFYSQPQHHSALRQGTPSGIQSEFFEQHPMQRFDSQFRLQQHILQLMLGPQDRQADVDIRLGLQMAQDQGMFHNNTGGGSFFQQDQQMQQEQQVQEHYFQRQQQQQQLLQFQHERQENLKQQQCLYQQSQQVHQDQHQHQHHQQDQQSYLGFNQSLQGNTHFQPPPDSNTYIQWPG